MNVKEIEIINNEKERVLTYGAEFIIDRTLNKFTDKIKIFHKRYLKGVDIYLLEFTKKIKGEIHENKFEFSKIHLKDYISLMKNIFYRGFNKNNIYKFSIKESQKIEFKILNEDAVKIVTYNYKDKRNFFVFTKREFFQYIKQIDLIYKGEILKNNTNNCFKIDIYKNMLSKKEKDSIYLEALYILANNALDLGDKEYFKNISNEIRKFY